MINNLKSKMTLKNITRFYLFLGLVVFISYGEYLYFIMDMSDASTVTFLGALFGFVNIALFVLFVIVGGIHLITLLYWAAVDSDKMTYVKFMRDKSFWPRK